MQTLGRGPFVWSLRPDNPSRLFNKYRVIHVFLLPGKNLDLTERDKESHLVAKGKLKCPRCESPPDVLARWTKTGDVRVYSHRWQEFHCHLHFLLQCLGKKEREVKSWEKTEPLLCGCKRHGGMSDRVNRNTLKPCKSLSEQTHLSHGWSRERLWKDTTHTTLRRGLTGVLIRVWIVESKTLPT